MSMNERLESQKDKMMDALFTPLFKAEEDEYFRVMEEEMKKDNGGGWLDLEDPADCLSAAIHDEDSADFVGDVLAGYIRFCEMVARVRQISFEDAADCTLIVRAQRYLEGKN